MKIKDITWQLHNDFYALMVCEHCGHEQEIKSGYDDEYYHTRVIPKMVCKKCSKNRDGDYARNDK